MPERIPQLDQMAAQAEGVTMLPATEIRRLGERRRTTRTVAVSTAVLVFALVAGFGIWQSPLLSEYRNPQWAATAVPETPDPSDEPTPVPSQEPTPDPSPEPTPSVSPTAAPSPAGSPSEGPGGPAAPAVDPPTWANAPTADMLFYDYAPGEIKNQYEGLGQAAKGLCDPGSYSDPSTILTREFGTLGDFPAYLEAMTLGYDSPAAASEGFDAIKAAALACEGPLADRAGLEQPQVYDVTAEVPFDPTVVDDAPVRMSYITYLGLIPDSDFGIFGETLLLQAGPRVLWVTADFEGQDNNCAYAPGNQDIDQCQVPAGIERMLNNLAER